MAEVASKQADWQRRKHAEGRCCGCGVFLNPDAPLGGWYCEVCMSKRRRAAREHARAKYGCKPWRPGGPGRPPVDGADR